MLGLKLNHVSKRGPKYLFDNKSVGSGNGLAPKRRQAITWTNGYEVLWGYVAWLGPVRTWWRHQMEAISALRAICAGNSPATGEIPTQRPVTRRFDVFFDLCLNKNVWVNNREAGVLRRHRVHYDAIVMPNNLSIHVCILYLRHPPHPELSCTSLPYEIA